MGAQQVTGATGFVGRQVVGHDNLSGPQSRGELVRDVGVEAVPVHRPVKNPWRDQAVLGKACDEGLGMPVAEGSVVDQARADGGPAGGFDKVGLQTGFVDEDQPFQHLGHVRLEGFDPGLAPLGHLGPQDFAGQQRFFYG